MLCETLFVTLSDYVNGGELFTHLNLREHFTEKEVKIYIGEIVLALETLHKVREYTQQPQFQTDFQKKSLFNSFQFTLCTSRIKYYSFNMKKTGFS